MDLINSGDRLYRMNYQRFMCKHRESGYPVYGIIPYQILVFTRHSIVFYRNLLSNVHFVCFCVQYNLIYFRTKNIGDHLYRMNYQHFIRKHRESGADITVSALPCDEAKAQAFGLMKIDETGRIIEFAEKPKGDVLQKMKVDTTVLGLSKERYNIKSYLP